MGFSACASGLRLVWTISLMPVLGRERVAERDHLAELPGRVDVQERERQPAGMKRLHGQADHDRRILADRIEHDRILELGRHLTDDVDALGLELTEVGEAVSAHCRRTARRAAVLEGPDGSWNGITGSTPGAGPRRGGHRPAAAGAIPHPQYIQVIIQASPRPSRRVFVIAAASHHVFVPGRSPRRRRRPAGRAASLGRCLDRGRAHARAPRLALARAHRHAGGGAAAPARRRLHAARGLHDRGRGGARRRRARPSTTGRGGRCR